MTLAVITPGAAAPHNMISAYYYGLPLYHTAVIGIVTLVAMLFIGDFFMSMLIKRAKARGEHFVERPTDFPNKKGEENYPPLWRILIAMVQYPLCLNFLPIEVMFFKQVIAWSIGMIVLIGYWEPKSYFATLKNNIPNSAAIILGQCSVMGFGSVFTSVSAYKHVISFLANMPVNAYVKCAVATTAMAGMTGSATSGMNITLNSVGSLWQSAIDAGSVSAGGIARITSLSSLCLDSLPHNGSINGLCAGMGETIKESYIPIFFTTVVTPAIGTVIMIILLQLFPFLP